MDDLSTQQQKIVDSMALAWDGVSAGEIAQFTRLESKKVSAQLKLLIADQVVRKIETKTKNHLYQLTERFFNIWYLMRFGRRYDRKRVIWLTRFFESWCDRHHLSQRAKRHIQALQKIRRLK